MVIEARLGDFGKLEIRVEIRTMKLWVSTRDHCLLEICALKLLLLIYHLYSVLVVLFGLRIAAHRGEVAIHDGGRRRRGL